MTPLKNQWEIADAAERIRALCSVLTKAARSDLEANLKRSNAGITAIEHGVLRHLSAGVPSMAQISRRMGVAPSTLVYVVDGLEKKHLLRRVKNPDDRRKEPLALTKLGAQVFKKSSSLNTNNFLVQGLQTMSSPERHELLRLLEQMASVLTGPERLYLDTKNKGKGR